MSVSRGCIAVCLITLACLYYLATPLPGQGLTGQISGHVADPSGASVPEVKIEITNVGTGAIRSATSDSVGTFVVPELLPGVYTVVIKAAGFQSYELKDVVVTATERVALRPIILALGDLTQSVSVTSTAAKVQTQSAERSGLVTASQLQEIPLKGRHFLSMIRLLPGVVDTGNNEAPVDLGLDKIRINGGGLGSINLALDGISNLDTGNMSGPQMIPGLESIAEVKVLLSNYQAEYGRSSQGTINTITKAGTKEFHGGAYYFKRNEHLNANNFFNNKNRLPRPQYRFDYPGYYLGGPLLLPGVNRNRDKLFFFWSQEVLMHKQPTDLARRTFPTALERQGNFSQSVDTNGVMIPILDPLNNRQPFSGNIVPPNRINAGGQALLNRFPLPNTVDPNRAYNTVFQGVSDQPHQVEILRVDWNLSPSTTFYTRGIKYYDNEKGSYGQWFTGAGWPHFPAQNERNSHGLVMSLIHTFDPTMVNEFTWGVNRRNQRVSFLSTSDQALNDRNKLGLNLPQFHPEINPYNLVPNVSFGGISNAPNENIESRFPFFGTNNIWNFTDNFSKVWKTHNLKAGFYIERTSRNSARGSNFNGTFNFDRNVNNPFDANYAFANAALGYLNSYAEADKHISAHGRFANYEWFVQDNWRVSKRLTLDLGVRFYRIVPTWSQGDQLAYFNQSAYDPSMAPKLIAPYLASGGVRMGINPNTGEVVPAVKIGTFAPGSGVLYDGMTLLKDRIMTTPPIAVTPRIGFAWNIFGDGKMALRGGFGMFLDRFADDRVGDHTTQAPLVRTSTAYYTTIPDLFSSPLSLSPGNGLGIQRDFRPPGVYNWSLGIQRDIGFGTVAEVAYVGSVARHLLQQRNLNALPYGTNFLPSSIDPTVSGNKPLPANFLRGYQGFADIMYTQFAGSSNYHSMQTQVHRRFAQNLMFGAVWTWSKSLSYGTPNPFMPARWTYGHPDFDRAHNLAINYTYDLPKVSPHWDNGFSRWVLDNWQVSGITSFLSGQPMGFGFSFVNAVDITGAAGSGVDTRVNLVCNPTLPKGDRTFSRFFRTECVAPPSAESLGRGNAPPDAIRGPGLNNWDLSVLKNFPLGKEGARNLELRFEMYNAFNHAQFTGMDTGARFDAQGKQVNSQFGQMTSAADPRKTQLGLKFSF